MIQQSLQARSSIGATANPLDDALEEEEAEGTDDDSSVASLAQPLHQRTLSDESVTGM